MKDNEEGRVTSSSKLLTAVRLTKKNQKGIKSYNNAHNHIKEMDEYKSFKGACGGIGLRHYATNQKVTGSIPDGIIEIFQ
jgi:hypothetical protein